MLFKKIRASAMYFAILVASIVGLLLSSFLLLTYTHGFFKTQSDLLLNTIDGSQKGIEYNFDKNNSFRDSITLSKENLEITIKNYSWGGYILTHSKAVSKTKVFEKMALIGASTSKARTAIYVADNLLPLVLVGDSKIEGVAYISDKGIKAGVIAGNYFRGKQLIYGTIKQSDGLLPKLDPNWLDNTTMLLKYIPNANDLVIGITQEISNSFLDPIKTIYSGKKLTISEKFIGNIIIKSESEIVITKHASLLDVLLIAPKITIEKGFKGVLHALAEKQITLEESVTLDYPSSLTLIDSNIDAEKMISKGEEPIYISEKVVVSGTIIYISKADMDSRSNTSITLQSESTINGSIYCSGNTELLGTVKGSVYTQRFVTNEFGSKYINHIYNGQVLANDLSKQYCGLPLKSKKKGVVRWLY